MRLTTAGLLRLVRLAACATTAWSTACVAVVWYLTRGVPPGVVVASGAQIEFEGTLARRQARIRWERDSPGAVMWRVRTREAEMPDIPQDIDISKPHPARMYDYYLGGKNHFAADRETADKMVPTARTAARENRGFLGRAVRYLTAEAGIRQFLDIGTGLPTTGNVHEVAQAVAPSSRVVYVDNDPLVLAHARALLTSSPEGRSAYIQADLRDPQAILDDPATRDVLDFDRPVALVLAAVLHFMPDHFQPATAIATLLDALPSGSYLIASHATAEHVPESDLVKATRAYQASGVPWQPRDSDDFAKLAFGRLDLIPPGVVLVSQWRPDSDGPFPAPSEVNCYGGVALKP
jgi:hypothetical protein